MRKAERLRKRSLRSFRLTNKVRIFRMQMYGYSFYIKLYLFMPKTLHMEFRTYDRSAFFISETGYRSHFPGLCQTEQEAIDLIKGATPQDMELLINTMFKDNIQKSTKKGKAVAQNQLNLF